MEQLPAEHLLDHQEPQARPRLPGRHHFLQGSTAEGPQGTAVLQGTVVWGQMVILVLQVILSACSNTFKSILKETNAPHPVIVLWDIEARDVSALLDFMYNGQVRVVSLNYFLEFMAIIENRSLE